MNPLHLLLRLFSSIRFGIALLAVLFVYSSLGSAGLWAPGYGFIQIRQFPAFEMTEFEWFHWWPFDLLILLICINITVATLRRIKFKPVNYGVWMIHGGIIILAIGSVIYFSNKVEGDAPVIRRHVVIELPSGESAALEAIPGNTTTVGSGSGAYTATIFDINPSWEILSGEDKGKKSYAVTVNMRSADGSERFMRQLIAGYPQYTEDTIPTGNPQQPFARAIKQIGKPLANEAITMRLEYEPQDYFYLAANITKCFALYMRPVGSREWTQRPIEGLPLYNDYIGDADEVWLSPSDDTPTRPLDITVPAAEASDPLASTPVRITSYLRYAVIEDRRLPGGEELSPVVSVRLRAPGRPNEDYTLAALDPARSVAARGQLQFRWIGDERELEALMEVIDPALIWTDPSGVKHELAITQTARANAEAPFMPLEGTPYSYRVEFVDPDLEIVPGKLMSVASVEVKTAEKSFKRWVFTDPTFNRDMPMAPVNPHTAPADMHADTLPFDSALQLELKPGKRPPAVTIVAGPDENDIGVVVAPAGGKPSFIAAAPGKSVQLPQDITLDILRYSARTHSETRPFVVPRAQRDANADIHNAMVRVELPSASGTRRYWVPYHHWAFEDENESLRRFPYRPAVVEGPDGKQYEVILSRQRHKLPYPVVLDDFRLTTQVGGFTGDTRSVRDWTSLVRFRDGESWSEPLAVSVNAPVEFGGLWYFQAQWDPPMPARFQGDVSSAGLNYTVLGVGSRHGVLVQLAGCCIAVFGMIYAFYVKPAIRRRDRNRALRRAEELARQARAASHATPAAPEALVPVGSSRELIEGAQP